MSSQVINYALIGCGVLMLLSFLWPSVSARLSGSSQTPATPNGRKTAVDHLQALADFATDASDSEMMGHVNAIYVCVNRLPVVSTKAMQ